MDNIFFTDFSGTCEYYFFFFTLSSHSALPAFAAYKTNEAKMELTFRLWKEECDCFLFFLIKINNPELI